MTTRARKVSLRGLRVLGGDAPGDRAGGERHRERRGNEQPGKAMGFVHGELLGFGERDYRPRFGFPARPAAQRGRRSAPTCRAWTTNRCGAEPRKSKGQQVTSVSVGTPARREHVDVPGLDDRGRVDVVVEDAGVGLEADPVADPDLPQRPEEGVAVRGEGDVLVRASGTGEGRLRDVAGGDLQRRVVHPFLHHDVERDPRDPDQADRLADCRPRRGRRRPVRRRVPGKRVGQPAAGRRRRRVRALLERPALARLDEGHLEQAPRDEAEAEQPGGDQRPGDPACAAAKGGSHGLGPDSIAGKETGPGRSPAGPRRGCHPGADYAEKRRSASPAPRASSAASAMSP